MTGGGSASSAVRPPEPPRLLAVERGLLLDVLPGSDLYLALKRAVEGGFRIMRLPPGRFDLKNTELLNREAGEDVLKISNNPAEWPGSSIELEIRGAGREATTVACTQLSFETMDTASSDHEITLKELTFAGSVGSIYGGTVGTKTPTTLINVTIEGVDPAPNTQCMLRGNCILGSASVTAFAWFKTVSGPLASLSLRNNSQFVVTADTNIQLGASSIHATSNQLLDVDVNGATVVLGDVYFHRMDATAGTSPVISIGAAAANCEILIKSLTVFSANNDFSIVNSALGGTLNAAGVKLKIGHLAIIGAIAPPTAFDGFSTEEETQLRLGIVAGAALTADDVGGGPIDCVNLVAAIACAVAKGRNELQLPSGNYTISGGDQVFPRDFLVVHDGTGDPPVLLASATFTARGGANVTLTFKDLLLGVAGGVTAVATSGGITYTEDNVSAAP